MYDNTEKSLRFEQRVKRLRRNFHGSLERVLADAAALDLGARAGRNKRDNNRIRCSSQVHVKFVSRSRQVQEPPCGWSP